MAKEINEGRRKKNNQPLDAWYYNLSGQPYTDVAQVLAEIPESYRPGIPALMFADGFEYWFKPDIFHVVKKQVATVIPDWNAAEGTPEYIDHKPTIPAEQVNSDWDSTTGKSQLLNKPSIPDAQIQSDLGQTDNTKKDFIKGKETFLPDAYQWKLKTFAEVKTTAPIPPSNAERLANNTYGGYGREGAIVYESTEAGYIPDPNVALILTDVVWRNTLHNITDGVLNRCGVWSSLSAVNGQYIGFGREVIVTESKVYYIGVGADNYMSIEVNSVLIKAFPAGDSNNGHYENWHLFPVFLSKGSNIIHVTGYNDAGLATIGVEIYNATLAELQNVGSVAALDVLTIFSTKSLIGSFAEEGNFGVGYTCPAGYSLVNRSGVYSCEKIGYGEIIVNRNDIVEFKKGSSPDFVVYTDPLDTTHKVVELPSSNKPFDIFLPNASSVQARCDGVLSLPDGWVISAAPDQLNDLLITHNLGRQFCFATVLGVAGITKQLFRDNGAFSGIISQSENVLRIQGLTAKTVPLVIHLFFS